MNKRYEKTKKRIAISCVGAVAACIFFALYGAIGFWSIIGPLRLVRLGALLTVAVALATSTVVFQAITQNRILSPGVMGFDSMYALTLTAGTLALGAATLNRIPAPALFVGNAFIMMVAATAMFMALISKQSRSLHLLVLVGIVMGTLFRSLSAMIGFIMDPNELLSVQVRTTASFALVNQESLALAAPITALTCIYIWRKSPTWDVLALGRDIAVELGVPYQAEMRKALAASALLVACATALVGPLMFFGLLVVNIAVFLVRSDKIKHLIIASSALGIVILVGGQALLEHVLSYGTVLPVLIELVGGLVLLTLIYKESQ